MKVYVKILFFFPLLVFTAAVTHQVFFNTQPEVYFLSLNGCSNICHQTGFKSFYVDGQKMPLCARCTGIYSGAFIAFIAFLFTEKFFSRKYKYYVIIMFLMAADVIFVTAGLYNYNKIISFSTGILFGYATFYYICRGLEKLLCEMKIGKEIE